jgi:hypothetical protein
MGKNKGGICMADGGITETPEQLMARIQSKYGVSGNSTSQPAPQPAAPAPAPVVKQASASNPMMNVAGLLIGRKAAIDKASNFADGGIVKGNGTPTSDEVPVKIKGQDYNLSDTEVVLPSKTRQALGEMLGAKKGDISHANALVERFIAQTNGKPPVQVEEGTSLADGGLIDDPNKPLTNPAGGDSIKPPVRNPMAIQAGNVGYGQVQYGQIGQQPKPEAIQPTPLVQRGPTAQPVASPAVAPAPATTAAPKPIDTSSGPTVSDGAGGVYTPEKGNNPMGGIVGFFKDSAQAARGDKPYEQIRAERAANGGESPIQTPTATASNSNFGPTNSFGQGNPMTKIPDGGMGFMTGAETGKAPVPVVKPGYNADGVITADSAAAATGGNMTRSGGISGSFDGKGVNEILARENKARGEMIDSSIRANGGNGVAILGGDGPTADERANAEKTARWNAEATANSLKGTGRAGNAMAQILAASMNGQNNLAAEKMKQQTATAGQSVQMRGQDLAAQAEAAKMAGNPMDNALKATQVQSGQMGLAKEKQHQDMLSQIHAETDPAKRQSLIEGLLAGQGKNPAEHRYIKVEGGEVLGPDGFNKIKQPSGVFDAVTKQFIPMDHPDAAPAGAAPHKDGTKLLGKDGKQYIVQNGVPVLAQ